MGVSGLIARTQGLPETLLNAGVLVARATAIPPTEARVTERLRRQHVHVDHTDVPELVRLWRDTCAAVDMLHHTAQAFQKSSLCDRPQCSHAMALPSQAP